MPPQLRRQVVGCGVIESTQPDHQARDERLQLGVAAMSPVCRGVAHIGSSHHSFARAPAGRSSSLNEVADKSWEAYTAKHTAPQTQKQGRVACNSGHLLREHTMASAHAVQYGTPFGQIRLARRPGVVTRPLCADSGCSGLAPLRPGGMALSPARSDFGACHWQTIKFAAPPTNNSNSVAHNHESPRP